jgi:molybdenum cofactor cytidylyltransferase
MTLAAVVLAAGAGSRFAGSAAKLLADFRGRPLLVWAVAAAVEAGLDETIVVTGAVDLDHALADAGLLSRVTVLTNSDWAAGQATSLALAVDAARAAGHEAVVVGLGDQPLIPAEAWRRVAAGSPDHPIVVATYGGKRRNPVRLDHGIWDELPRTGDAGGRVLMAGRPELIGEVACPGEPVDVDTMEDLARWS